MKIKLIRMTRDSYCASDDADAPHEQTITILNDATLEGMVQTVHQKMKASIRRDNTEAWVITSKHPIAVVCGKWDKPRMLLRTVRRTEDSLLLSGTTAHLHYCLIQNIEPETLYKSMDRLRYPYLHDAKTS